jgi:hypothetical protein
MAGMILKGASFVTGAARIASLQTVCGFIRVKMLRRSEARLS